MLHLKVSQVARLFQPHRSPSYLTVPLISELTSSVSSKSNKTCIAEKRSTVNILKQRQAIHSERMTALETTSLA